MNDSRDPKDLLDWLGLKNAPTWRVARPLGYLFGFTVVGLFLLAVAAAAWTVLSVFTTPTGASFGTGALLVALLGAPFLVWRTIIAQKTVDFQKEGHITDRIAKAVEQLGAEKTVDRIGRPVTLWTGLPVEGERFFPHPDPIDLPPRSEEIGRANDMRTVSVNLVATTKNGTTLRYRQWPEVRTVIEWQGKPLDIASNEKLATVGDWKTFAESLPNIEVRIGGILSLERIAQDSTAYDQGRDHVPIMEILCAYIRENAPASGAKDHRYGEWVPLKDDATEEERKAHELARRERFGLDDSQGIVREWAETLPPTRQDIALALQVIGRRNAAQRLVEARWGKDAAPDAEWPFDTPAPTLLEQDALQGQTAIETFRTELAAWKKRLEDYAGYRLDLAHSPNLQGTSLSGLTLSGAMLHGARLQGVHLRSARLEGAVLWRARLEGAFLPQARLEGANLRLAELEGADLTSARLQGANLRGARLEGANLRDARLEGVNLRDARLEGADLSDVRMDETTSLRTASLRGAALKEVDLVWVPFSKAQVDEMFGDASVILPEGFTRPAHWPCRRLNRQAFHTEWRKWLADPATYTPPDCVPPLSSRRTPGSPPSR